MNKVVIVTGGSRGIGAATSKLLAKQGYAVCINYHQRPEPAEALVEEITASGGKAFAYQADAACEKQVQAMFVATRQRFGTVTHLVNNAGILFTQSELRNIDADRFRKVLDTNVMSCFVCSKSYINQIDADSEMKGAIVNVSSAASRIGAPFEYIDYAASKGAMDSITIGLSLELAGQGIRVNCVRPGCIYTEMHADGGEPGRVDRLGPNLPLKRGGTPEEVANSIAWLLSEEASFVTGTFIDIAGGR